MIKVRHRPLTPSDVFAGRHPVQVEDGDDSVGLECLHVALDRMLVSRATDRGADPVDTKPAVLIEGDPHGVDAPCDHRLHGGAVGRAIKDASASEAGILGTRAIHAQQAHRFAALVHETVAPHSHIGSCRRGCRAGRARARLWRVTDEKSKTENQPDEGPADLGDSAPCSLERSTRRHFRRAAAIWG